MRPTSISSALADALESDIITGRPTVLPRRTTSDSSWHTTATREEPAAGPSRSLASLPSRDSTPTAQLVLESDSDDAASVDYFSEDDDALPPLPQRPPSLRSVGSGRSSFAIRIDENDQLSGFVRECTISSVAAVQAGKPGGYVVFELDILTVQGTSLRTMKRYSHFVKLRKALLAELPKSQWRDAVVPRLPPKHLKKFKPELLERRRQTLAFWLQAILMHPQIGSCPTVKQWLLE